MEASIINAITKNRQSEEKIRVMAEKALGKTIDTFQVKELAGGLCNAVYLVIANDQSMVLKIASPKEVMTMRHEVDYVPIEARILQTFQEQLHLPIPQVIYYDDTGITCPEPYFFMTYLDGEPLAHQNPKPSPEELADIKYQVGKLNQEISSLTVPYYGVPAMPKTYTAKNSIFVKNLFEMLLWDARDAGVEIPEITPEELLALIEEFAPVLDLAERPCYIHTDTWEGNILVKNNQFVGLVDFAAVLFGDPLMNHDFHDFSPFPNEDFLRGFGKREFTNEEWTRIVIYKIWQRLGMILEDGFRGYDNPDQYAWVKSEFTKEIRNLRNRRG